MSLRGEDEGDTEPDETTGLGWLVAESVLRMECAGGGDSREGGCAAVGWLGNTQGWVRADDWVEGSRSGKGRCVFAFGGEWPAADEWCRNMGDEAECFFASSSGRNALPEPMSDLALDTWGGGVMGFARLKRTL